MKKTLLITAAILSALACTKQEPTASTDRLPIELALSVQTKATDAAYELSLIHISEPTRPY